MDMTENKTLTIIRNIRWLTKGKAAGTFEKECGVCRGYLARAEQGQVTRMSVATALKMAEKLGYTIEELSDPDFIRKRRIAEINNKIEELNEQRDALN